MELDVVPLDGPPELISTSFDLAVFGYRVEEHLVSGKASSFEADGPLGDDGKWPVRRGDRAPFTTRVVVYRPADPDAFGGTAVVEWLNVTAGLDTPASWLTTHRHLMRAGMAWVGVSAQSDGLEGRSVFAERDGSGGPLADLGLRPLAESSPERYGRLAHPGNAYSFDIFDQVRALVRGDLVGAEVVLAAGQSQSAAHLVTYINAVAPLTGGYDGYLVHGRPGTPAGLERWDVTSLDGAVRIRTDGSAPILTLQSETDVVGTLRSAGSRQDDDERFRLWEVAGAAHAGTYLLSAAFQDSGRLPAAELAKLLAPTSNPHGMALPAPVNSGPQQHYVAQAAVAALDRWVRGGEPPAGAERLELVPDDSSGDSSDRAPRLRGDTHGIALGGVRTPWVDVPAAVLSGLGQEAAPGAGQLFGSTRPIPQDALREMYPDGDYARRFREAAERAVADGFLLADDLEEAVGIALAAYPG